MHKQGRTAVIDHPGHVLARIHELLHHVLMILAHAFVLHHHVLMERPGGLELLRPYIDSWLICDTQLFVDEVFLVHRNRPIVDRQDMCDLSGLQ